MTSAVCANAMLTCSFGVAPCSLAVLPKMIDGTSGGVATIMDYVPFMNIGGFNMCTSPANPAVIAAFGAPQPCTPLIPAPWAPGSPKVTVGNFPALTSNSKAVCVFGGMIRIANPGQVSIDCA